MITQAHTITRAYVTVEQLKRQGTFWKYCSTMIVDGVSVEFKQTQYAVRVCLLSLICMHSVSWQNAHFM